MRKLTQIITLIAFVASSGVAYAQAAPGRAPLTANPQPENSCYFFRISEGSPAKLKQVVKAKEADVRAINTCEAPAYEKQFGVYGQVTAVMNNEELRQYLRTKGYFPDNVLGVRHDGGELIIYVQQTRLGRNI